MKHYIIEKSGSKWILWTKDKSKKLGEFDSKEEALKRERQIQWWKTQHEEVSDEDAIQTFAEDLTTISDVDVFAIGTWRGVNSPPEGDKYEAKDLDAMVDAFKAGVVNPNLKITHGDDKEQVDVGQVSNLRRVGQKLVADFVNVPGALKELMQKGLFKARSAEVIWNLKDKAGKMWPRVIKAVALLAPGQRPAVGALSEGYKFEAVYSYELDQDYAGNISSIIGSWKSWAGGFNRCVSQLSGKPGITDPKRLCAWLEKRATGKWPAQHQAAEDYKPDSEEIRSTELVAGGILSYLDQEDKLKEDIRMMSIEKLMKKYGVETEEALEKVLDKRDEETRKAQARIKEMEAAESDQRKKDVDAFLEEAKKDGKILPKEEGNIRKQFETHLEKGDTEAIDNLKTFIRGLNKRVELDEKSRDIHSDEYSSEKPPAVEVDRLAKAYISEGKAKDYNEGLRFVSENHAELWTKYIKR